MSQIALGIYVQDHTVAIGFVTANGQCIGSSSRATADLHLSNNLITWCEALQKECNVASFHQVGMVKDTIENDVTHALATQLQTSSTSTKPGVALASYEAKWGHALNEPNFVAISMRNTLDSGLFLNGKLAHGNKGLAGEIGDLIVHEHQQTRRLSSFFSEEGIKATTFQHLANQTITSTLQAVSYQDFTIDHLLQAIADKDVLALRVVEYLGGILGLKLSDIVNYFSPQYFVLSGFSDQLIELLIKHAAPKMEASLFPVFKDKIKVIASKSQGEQAKILQAAAVAF